jgi:hypothetical protein
MSDQQPRTDEQIARLLYGDGSLAKPTEESEEAGETEEVGQPKEPAAPRSMEQLGELIYPEKNPRYADVDEHGNVGAVIRELDSGRILAQQKHGDEGNLAASSSPLPNADLSEAPLSGRTLDHGIYHDSSIRGNNCEDLSAKWCDLRNLDARGTKLIRADLGFSDCRGLVTDEETDISFCNFMGCAIDKAAYERLVRCKGADSAKGLAVRDMPPAKR